MPAQGRGANLKPNEVTPAYHAPLVYSPTHVAAANALATIPRSQPFDAGLSQAQQHLVSKQRALPRAPTPNIPFLPNPTPRQAQAAISLAKHSQELALGPNPGVERIQRYQQELRNDPRQARYLATVAHYERAAEGHALASRGRAAYSGSPTISQSPDAADSHLSRALAVALGRRAVAQAPHNQQAVPNKAPSGVSLPLLGTIVPGHDVQDVESAIATALPGLAGHTPETQFARNALGDVKTIGELPLIGGYQVASAGGQLFAGKPAAAEHLTEAVAKGFAHGSVGELLQGHLAAAQQAFLAHPVLTALEASGESGILGRAGGAAARTLGDAEAGGVRGALANIGSTVRSPIALTEDAGAARGGLVHERTFSKDLLRKTVQAVSDKRREPVLDAEGEPVTVTDRGRTVPVLHARSDAERERLQAHRANFQAGRANAVERGAREEAQRAIIEGTAKDGKGPLAARAELKPEITGRASLIKVKGQKPMTAANLGRHLSLMVASGTIRSAETFKADLDSRIATIKGALGNHAEDYRTTKERELAEGNLHILEAARHPKVLSRAQGIVKQGLAHAESLNKLDAEQERLDVYPAGQLARARLSEYALAHMGAVHDGKALRTADGKPLTDDAIRAHAQAAGRNPDTLAYLPHRLANEAARSFHKQFRPGGRPIGRDELRTGALFKRGATAIHPSLVKDELTNKATTVAKVGQIDRFVSENGLRHPALEKSRAGQSLTPAEKRIVDKGGYFTGKESIEAADRLSADGRGNYVPVRAFAAKLSADTRERLGSDLAPAAMETAHTGLLNDRFVDATDGSRTRNVVLVPAHQLSELEKQLKPAGEVEKSIQLLNGPFRMAVLPQPKWLTGNFIEPYIIRLPLSGSGVNLPGFAMDLHTASKAVKALEDGTAAEKQAAQEIRAMQFQGLFVGRKGASIRRTYQDFTGRTARALYGAHVVRNLPVLKQLGDLTLAIPHIFFHVNRVIESAAQRAAFGNQLRKDLQEAQGSWLKAATLGSAAMEDAKRGLVNTATQHRFMEAQYKLLGQYEGWSPGLRRLVQGPMPFLPWTLASMRFVYWTLPAHHTAAFDTFIKAGQSVLPQWEKEHADTPPGTLRASPEGADGGFVNLPSFTPFGITQPLSELGDKGVSASTATESLTGTLLPQVSGALQALGGKDPFGRELEVKGGKPTGTQELGIAANQVAESLVPLLSIGRRLQEGGGTAYANSTILSPQTKPGSSHQSAISRTFNPFRETYLKAPTVSATDGGELSPVDEAHAEQVAREVEDHLESPGEQALIRKAEEEAERAGG